MHSSEIPWHPDEEDKKMIHLMFDIGRTYNEYYFFNYGKDLGVMFERLSLTILKMRNKHELNYTDKTNYVKLRDKLKNKLNEILNPRFLPGELAVIPNGIPCTVTGKPYVSEITRKIVVDVLFEGMMTSVEVKHLKPLERKKRVISVKNHDQL